MFVFHSALAVLTLFVSGEVFGVAVDNSSSILTNPPSTAAVTAPPMKTTKKPMNKADSYNITHLLQTLLAGYDKRLRPNFGGPPVNVTATIYVEFIGDIDEINMEFTTIFYFRQYWHDPRLSFEHTGYKKRLAFNPEMLKFIWAPDTHFPGLKEGTKHDITSSNEVVRIMPNGTVLYSMRLKAISQCPMDLRNFPMDYQTCKLKVEAYSYDDQEMTLNWRHVNDISPVGIASDIEIPSYSLTSVKWHNLSEAFSTGNYDLLVIEFSLQRRLGFHMIQIYLPSYLIVILAWVSFWVDREQTTARIAMGITTVLTMATLIGSARISLPKVSYVKSMELYLIMCFLFVFAAILEYAFVSYLVFRQRYKERELFAEMQAQEAADTQSEANGDKPGQESSRPTSGTRTSGQEAVWIANRQQVEAVVIKNLSSGKGGKDGKKSDMEEEANANMRLLERVEFFSRLLFPIIFVALNVVYWFYFMVLAD